MSSLFKNLSKELLSILTEQEILKNISIPDNYPDEPRMFRYSAFVAVNSKFTDGQEHNINASGFSFFDREFALLKCLAEASERFCSVSYRNKNLLKKSTKKIGAPFINLAHYPRYKISKSDVFSWVEGVDLQTKSKVFIPAQRIYYNYKLLKGEPMLSELNSTGAAGGIDHESTLLRGIYEIVERDAFMSVYLAQIKAPRIDIKKMKAKNIQLILAQSARYNLEVMVFDITNDLKIPSFLSVVIDRTGIGPSISLGLKSSLNSEHAIIGSIEESFHIRPWIRQNLVKLKDTEFKKDPAQINSISERALFWAPTTMMQKVSFLLNQPKKTVHYPLFKLSKKAELKQVLEYFKENSVEVHFADISQDLFKPVNFLTYQVVIPQLQPLFLHEHNKEVRLKRLEKVAKHFKQKVEINNTPHPFL